MYRRALLKGLGVMPFGQSRTQGFSNPVLALLEAGNTIINKKGMFVYAGPPAAGNLQWSNTNAAGIDKYGNIYLNGETNYYNTGSRYLAFQIISSSIAIYSAISESAGWGAPVASISTSSAGATTVWNRSGNPIALEVLNGYLAMVGQDNDTWSISESAFEAIVSGAIRANRPGSGFPAKEIWHTPGALANGWINTAGFQAFGYRLTNENDVQIRGVISATAATSSTFFTLAAPYIPVSEQGYGVGATGGNPAGSGANLREDTSGNLIIASAAAVPAADSYFINGFISLD